MKTKYKSVRDRESTDPSATLWRPWTLRRRFLICFAVLCILLIVSIELLIIGCSHGCRIFGEGFATKLSGSTNFAYTQLPAAVTLALSLLWTLPYHDILRLEPYFQMSTEGGATADDSIFLQYPYIFALFVPYYSAKSRFVPVVLFLIAL